jgi:hypothetical protein
MIMSAHHATWYKVSNTCRHFLRFSNKIIDRGIIIYDKNGYSMISRKQISHMASIMKILGGIIVMLAMREIGFREIALSDKGQK